MPQSWNRYTYCLNNPLVYIDPDGLKWYNPKGLEDIGFTPVWRDDDPDQDYEEITQHVYWAGDEHRWGRFTGIDPDNYQAKLDLTDPQSWNARGLLRRRSLDGRDQSFAVRGGRRHPGYETGERPVGAY